MLRAPRPLCWLLRRRLSALADAELEPTARRRIEAHVERCGRCAAELADIDRLRADLADPATLNFEPPAEVWEAFWPAVRARLDAQPADRSWWQASRERWLRRPVVAHPRLAFGSALAATAIAVLSVLAPWQETPVGGRPEAPPAPTASLPVASVAAEPGVVVHSLETGDPQSNAMVFANPESDVTVVWVFGLPRTGT